MCYFYHRFKRKGQFVEHWLNKIILRNFFQKISCIYKKTYNFTQSNKIVTSHNIDYVMLFEVVFSHNFFLLVLWLLILN